MSRNVYASMPCARTSSTLCVRPFPDIVRAPVSNIVHSHLQAISESYNLKQPTSNFHGLAPTAKVIQWMACWTFQTYQPIGHPRDQMISLKNIRVQQDPWREDHYVVSLRVAPRCAEKRHKKVWAPFWLVRCNSTPFVGDVKVMWVDRMVKGDSNEKRFEIAFMSHYEGGSPNTCYHEYEKFLSFARHRAEDYCERIHSEMDGGHLQQCQISDMCRQMSITPHRWKGNRHVHSFVNEWPVHRNFMKDMDRLNSLLEYEIPGKRQPIIQMQMSDAYPPLELVADWCEQYADSMNRRLLQMTQEQATLEHHHNQANIRLLERDLERGETINTLFDRVDHFRKIEKKAYKVLEVCREVNTPREDPGACLWTHR